MARLKHPCPHCQQDVSELEVVACAPVFKGTKERKARTIARLRCPKCRLSSSSFLSASAVAPDTLTLVEGNFRGELAAAGWKIEAVWPEAEVAAIMEFLPPENENLQPGVRGTKRFLAKLTGTMSEFFGREETQEVILQVARVGADKALAKVRDWAVEKGELRDGRNQPTSTKKRLPNPRAKGRS